MNCRAYSSFFSGTSIASRCGLAIVALQLLSPVPFALADMTAVVSANDAGNCLSIEGESGRNHSQVIRSASVRIVTLNLAHGRKDRMNQALLRSKTIRSNLADVADFLNSLDSDVIGLQEADGVSRWSGRFDHVAQLASDTGKHCVVHGLHAKNRWYNFGTALLSSRSFTYSLQHDFQPSRPTTTKGFVLGVLPWNPDNSLATPIELILVSVHLDFSRQSVRASQIAEIIDVLKEFDGPRVLMGDFNTDWVGKDSDLRVLADGIGLHAFEPESEAYSTYHSKNSRLDWILLSHDLKFLDHQVMPQVVSDHLAVMADIGLVQ